MEGSTFQISTSVNEGIVENVVTGKVTKNTINRLQTELITIITRENAKAILIDVKAVTKHDDPLAEVYFRVRSTPTRYTEIARSYCRPNERFDLLFILRNRGSQCRPENEIFHRYRSCENMVKEVYLDG